ncbi:MAG: hypothetical protein OXN89_08590 [Bryobacterales bacterium]|nr:hypothetical protein [Bryobacterales bacterium]
MTGPGMPWRDKHTPNPKGNWWLASHTRGRLSSRSRRVREGTFNAGGFAGFAPTHGARRCQRSSYQEQQRVPGGTASSEDGRRSRRAASIISAARSAPFREFPLVEAACPGHGDLIAARAAQETA